MDNQMPQIQPVVPVPHTPCCSPKNKLVCLSAGLIILIIVALAAFAFGRNSTKPTSVTSQIPPPVSFSVSATPSVDPTANWKTYTDAQYGYSIKYPSNWLEKQKCWADPTTDTTCFRSPDYEFHPTGWGTAKGGEITIDKKDPWLDQPVEVFCTPAVTEFKETGGQLYCQEILVDGRTAIRTAVADNRMFNVGILENKKIVLVIRVGFNQESESQITQIFNQILSTFQFLDQKGEGIFLNDNPKAKIIYSLEYPAGWLVTSHEVGPRGAGYDDSRDLVTLSNGSASVTIFQAQSILGGGRFCLFPKDPECEGFDANVCDRYGDYTELTIFGKKARRARFISGNNPGHNFNSYYLCEERNGKFIDTTSVGNISYEAPQNISKKTLSEMDSIIESVEIKQ